MSRTPDEIPIEEVLERAEQAGYPVIRGGIIEEGAVGVVKEGIIRREKFMESEAFQNLLRQKSDNSNNNQA